MVPFTASVALDSVSSGVAVANEENAKLGPATIDKRSNTRASLMILMFMLMMAVTVKLLLSLVLAYSLSVAGILDV